jgi:hypothetical protein
MQVWIHSPPGRPRRASERKLLKILAWLAPEPIPLSLLEGVLIDRADARDALVGLVSWSLARSMADEDGFTVHRLIQEITRQRLSDNESAFERALKILRLSKGKKVLLNKRWRFSTPNCPNQIWARQAQSCGTGSRTTAFC